MPPAAALLEARGIEKRYGGTVALAGVDLQVAHDEILALVGENGAGKSTLGKILAGAVPRDGGTVLLNGTEVSFGSTRDALNAGVAIVLQEFNLIPEMSVAENIFLTRAEGYRRGWWRNRTRQQLEARQAIERLNMDFGINPTALVGSLSVAQQQIVEILRSLSVDARLFILDEPTAALGRQETDALLTLVRRLAVGGRAVILVTHRLEEVYAVADRIVVLRDGTVQGEFDPKSTAPDALIKTMVGRELGDELTHVRNVQVPGEVLLRVSDLTVPGKFDHCTFEVRRGEVVGIAGIVGSGRTELVRAVFGADRARAGSVEINGKTRLMRSPHEGLVAGAGLVPEDRKTQGLHTGLSILDNLTMGDVAKKSHVWLDRRFLRSEVSRLIDELQIKVAHPGQLASELSGGNQQKVVLGKWLMTAPDLLILDEPTRGIDVGARADFYRIIDSLVAAGLGILVVSSELPEV
ncbi:MAG: sugar ABC transporter ATP-binding protein, partial [Micrococcales bacterium]|nr:sugar ABC transporter ATP-binding protein [Micrococcales bacterium]